MTKHKSHATARQRRLALDALVEVAVNPDAADHARAAAARALLNSGDKRRNGGDNDDDAEQPTPLVMMLPDNGRDPAITRLGITRGEGSQYRIVYDAGSPEGLEDLARWQREVDAEIDGSEPPAEPFALPADAPPPKPRPLSAAERQARYRQRRRESAALSSPAQ
jgi:hypothetical protein